MSRTTITVPVVPIFSWSITDGEVTGQDGKKSNNKTMKQQAKHFVSLAKNGNAVNKESRGDIRQIWWQTGDDIPESHVIVAYSKSFCQVLAVFCEDIQAVREILFEKGVGIVPIESIDNQSAKH